MESQSSYRGTCFCNAVEVTVTGAPAAMGYCHCDACRSWSASPVNAFTLWKSESVGVTRGADNLATYNKTWKSYRKSCKSCGATCSPSIPAGAWPGGPHECK